MNLEYFFVRNMSFLFYMISPNFAKVYFKNHTILQFELTKINKPVTVYVLPKQGLFLRLNYYRCLIFRIT